MQLQEIATLALKRHFAISLRALLAPGFDIGACSLGVARALAGDTGEMDPAEAEQSVGGRSWLTVPNVAAPADPPGRATLTRVAPLSNDFVG
jgi:hypothetical protein